MQGRDLKELTISASLEDDRVIVRIRDTGRGITNPERLFRPFQPGAEATGLGLYLSREFVRAFNGDLRYEPASVGSCFVLDLMPYMDRDEEREAPETDG